MSAVAALPDIERISFVHALSQVVESAIGESSHTGLLLIDLSNMSKINHNQGYDTGDCVLDVAYQRLLQASKLPDTVFRIGGHTFAFILPSLMNPAFISLAVNKVAALLREEIAVGDYAIRLELNVGVAVNRQNKLGAMDFLGRAEASLRHVKRGGELDIEELLSDDGPPPSNGALEQEFVAALRDGDLEMYFQPKIDLRSGQVKSAEALLRWKTPGGEQIPPPTIVQLADTVEQSFELTKWIISQCMRTLSQWQGTLDLGLAINVQANLITHADLLSTLQDSRAIWGVEDSKLTIEITEDAVIEDEDAGFANLIKIRDAGMPLSIDDFGTGYSSMSYFRQIPAAELKIDQSFVRTMMDDDQSHELVKIMVQIGHQFGMQVVGEGVEDAACFEALKALGCDLGQGYFFSPPLPREEFEAWMAAWNTSNGFDT